MAEPYPFKIRLELNTTASNEAISEKCLSVKERQSDCPSAAFMSGGRKLEECGVLFLLFVATAPLVLEPGKVVERAIQVTTLLQVFEHLQIKGVSVCQKFLFASHLQLF